MPEARKVDFVCMGDHFLYLPLYYAISNQFFGYCKKPGVQYRFGDAPQLAKTRTDTGVYDRLVDTLNDRNRTIKFAIGDPRRLVTTHSWRAEVALVGALVTSTAFWAVNHGANKARKVSDLPRHFKKIVSYPQGSTSYDLAASIANAGGGTLQIEQVQDSQELVYLERSDEDTVVLSPDIVNITNLLSTSARHFSIELYIGAQYDFSDILVTAVATTRGVIQEEPELVFGVLKGLQRALDEIHARTDALTEYAADRFVRGNQEELCKILDVTDRSRVFPYSIQLSEALWMRAFTGPLKTAGSAPTSQFLDDALDCYKSVGAQFEKMANRAVTSLHIRSPEDVSADPYGAKQTDWIGLSSFILTLIVGLLLMRPALTAGGIGLMLFAALWFSVGHSTWVRNVFVDRPDFRWGYWLFMVAVAATFGLFGWRAGPHDALTTKDWVLLSAGLIAAGFGSIVGVLLRRRQKNL